MSPSAESILINTGTILFVLTSDYNEEDRSLNNQLIGEKQIWQKIMNLSPEKSLRT